MRARGLVAACLVLATAALFFTAPMDGDFWWSDAPRHAMDGLFMRDLLLAHPFHHPAAWAIGYYVRHPALTILFYPPLFPTVEAGFFLVFGASHACAQVTVACFILLLGTAAYGLARMMLPRLAALGCALLVIGAPEAAFWGRQVMLDVPAYALGTAAAYCLAQYLREGRPGFFYASLLALDAAIYTKYNAAIVAPAFVLSFCLARPWQIWRDRHVMAALALAAMGLLPAVWLFYRFGRVNMQSVTGSNGLIASGHAHPWLYYAAQLPAQLGWVPLCIGVAGLFLLARAAIRERGVLPALLLGWLVCSYAAFSLIDLKAPRFDLMILLPLSVAACAAPCQWLPRSVGSPTALALGAGTLAYSLIFQPMPRVTGYRDIALWLAAHAPPHAVVVYDGYRDANLVFDLMTAAARPDIAVVRADKLLLSVPAGERATRGVTAHKTDASKIAAMLQQIGPDFVVVQPGFWADLPNMALFQQAIAPPAYRQTAAFPVTGTLSGQDGTAGIVIYQPTAPAAHGNTPLLMDMPDIGSSFGGSVR
jgi:4-amino-4-deoxy-L-arabinose transferase-like glycosyltransferase